MRQGNGERGFGQAAPKNRRTARELSSSYVRPANSSAEGAAGRAQARPWGLLRPRLCHKLMAAVTAQARAGAARALHEVG